MKLRRTHGTSEPGRKHGRDSLTAALLLLLFIIAFCLPGPARATEIKLEVTAEAAAIHLDPDGRSPVIETLVRGTVLTLSSALKFRTNWFYVLFVSSRSGRTLSGYVLDELVRKLNSSLRVIDLTPQESEIINPREIDLSPASLPAPDWGRTRASLLRTEGRPLSREVSGGFEFLRYRRDVLGKACLIAYVLNGQRLVAIRLHLLEKYADKNRYIADYNKIRDFMNEKAGEPRFDNIVWRDRACAEKTEDWGTALSSGGLSLSSEWVFSGTGLRLSLTGVNNEVLFAAEINDIKAKNPASF